MKVETIEPHGMCAGVNAAIAKALRLKDVWCLHELVHNEIVVRELKDLGFRFVDRIEDVPEGETVVFSAHGVAPSVREAAKARHLTVVDTTCPFVAKVHRAAREFAERGLPVVIIGDPEHAEVKGIAGEAGSVFYVDAASRRVNEQVPVDAAPSPRQKWKESSFFDATRASRPQAIGGFATGSTTNCQLPTKLGVVAQTTMNADAVAAKVEELRRDYDVETMAQVCNATKDRQDAVKKWCASQLPTTNCQLPTKLGVLVLGSRSSSNSRRLAEVAEECGTRAFLAGSMDELRNIDFTGIETLGVTSGASTPERFFMEAVSHLRNVPEHVAIIMDGNGRWATARGKKRGEGHVAGAKTLMNVLRWVGDRGIRYLTVYAFSTENWKRPKEEVDGLMALFARLLKAKERDFMKNRVRFRLTGRRGDLSPKLRKVVEALEEKTSHFERQFIVAVSYGGRAEIVDAANAAIAAGEPVTEETFKRFLYLPDVPDPDLVIRTSGELRTSNFLLWESAYAEYHFTKVLWPDFSEADLDAALADYAQRHRRVGGV